MSPRTSLRSVCYSAAREEQCAAYDQVTDSVGGSNRNEAPTFLRHLLCAPIYVPSVQFAIIRSPRLLTAGYILLRKKNLESRIRSGKKRARPWSEYTFNKSLQAGGQPHACGRLIKNNIRRAVRYSMLFLRWLVKLDIPTPNVLHTLFSRASNRSLGEWLVLANATNAEAGLSVMTNATRECRGLVCSKSATDFWTSSLSQTRNTRSHAPPAGACAYNREQCLA